MTNYIVTYTCVVTGDELTRRGIEDQAIDLWQQGYGQMEVEIDG